MATNSGVRRRWRRVDGVLLLDKPSGMTSNSALQGARRLFSAAKAGHTGTLDPLATGLLPVCFGEATKFSADLLDADKTYETDVLLGVTTDTGDADGLGLSRRDVDVSREKLESVLSGLRGQISQVPPMYSALKRDGRPLYELARQGIEVERAAREVTIDELQLLEFAGERCKLRVSCSKGTYIRTLVEDIGVALGCGAHLTALRRLRVGDLEVSQAVTLDQLVGVAEEARDRFLMPPDSLLTSLPAVLLNEEAANRFSHGNPVATENVDAQGKCRVYASDSRLLGVGLIDAAGRVHPRRLVSGDPS